jgi:hypothetical protein
MTRAIHILILACLVQVQIQAQVVEIQSSSINEFDQRQLSVESQAEHYYLLKVDYSIDNSGHHPLSMHHGTEGISTFTDVLSALPIDRYVVEAYSSSAPQDSDGDGIDDITELDEFPYLNPLNPAPAIDTADGFVAIESLDHFRAISKDGPFDASGDILGGREFVKFVIFYFDTDSAHTYFINMNQHSYHAEFFESMDGFNSNMLSGSVTGELIYHPTIFTDQGHQGIISMNFSWGHIEDFETVQGTYEILARDLPFLKNNFSYYILTEAEEAYYEELADYDASRVLVTLESDILSNIDYIPFNIAEGYGFFRTMSLSETPGSRDVVLYSALPNSLPRTAGIMTSVTQTPLSHVNLRAIQDGVPNAYVREPQDDPDINSLLGQYVHYKVEQDAFLLEQSSIEAVNQWYEQLRPGAPQEPALDLSFTTFLPLDEIDFHMSDAFGAKCSNMATMQTFGFPEGTIPDGYGLPFYFYQEFMEYNGFFSRIESMLADTDFIEDQESRLEMLETLRDDIEDGQMPQWMLDELTELQSSFPEGTSIRCRSSTNNEDLPGFSGAGLYTSKTHHPNEGHLSKTIKEVYASMWNFRAYDERDFYRIDQYKASMGVLCHPNFENEKANGVGVSTDPIYGTSDNFYLNTQIGEELVTNPDANNIPEELLLGDDTTPSGSFAVLRYSNLVDDNELILGEEYLDQMKHYLSVIHDEFSILYGAEDESGFAMDIEYKITHDDRLVIKQARPWASYWSSRNSDLVEPEIGEDIVVIYPNPSPGLMTLYSEESFSRLEVLDHLGRIVAMGTEGTNAGFHQVDLSEFAEGNYLIRGYDVVGKVLFTRRVIKL